MIILKTAIIVFQRKNIGVRGIDSPTDFDVYRSKDNKEEKS